MREIKFRAWDNSKKEMLYPKKAEDMTDKITSASLLAAYNDGGLDSIMQFTGLFDKNGKEIYEGDVVKSPGYDNQMVVKYEEIIASDDMTAPGIGFQFNTEPSGMEIIGNIYENPELIK